jgi:glycosyltransferase involved in cell wall biosynthesis
MAQDKPSATLLSTNERLISVLIPAYNAARTLPETLESVRRQTYSALEIIVIDDGSRDSTRAIAEAAAAEDPRIRVISQENRGLAQARNRALEEARGELVAPLDADDLWHPHKLAQQATVLSDERHLLGFVYCAFRKINRNSEVIGNGSVYRVRGRVLHRHLLVNFVGNGSSILARRSLVQACGGYDPSLRELGLEGVEDFMLQLQMAERAEVDVAPEYLVGYRQHERAMSRDTARMAKAYMEVMRRVEHRMPEVPATVFRWGLGGYLSHCALESMHIGRRRIAAKLAFESLRQDPWHSGRTLLTGLRHASHAGVARLRRRVVWNGARPTQTRRHFYDYQSTEALRETTPAMCARLSRVEMLEARTLPSWADAGSHAL